MKLEVYEPKVKTKEEEPTRLQLHQTDQGIFVRVVDENGNPFYCSNLILFEPDGTIARVGGVNETLGFQLEKYSKKVVIEDNN